jgi:PAS domain S-box-containing protein
MSAANIMLVEDERIVAKSLQSELTSMGYKVPAVASSGEEALKKVEETWPDLVLMDIVLKGDMDGVEVSEEIRDRYDIPVVYLTAYADDATLRRAKITEPYGYLLKPYEEKELHTTIELALFKHKMQGISQEMRHWLGAVIRSIGDGLIVTDARGNIRLINRAGEKLTGCSEENAFGKSLPEVFHLLDRNTRMVLDNPISRAVRENRPVNLERNAVLITTDGKEIAVEGNIAPITDDSGSLAGSVMVFRERPRSQENRSSEERPCDWPCDQSRKIQAPQKGG